MMYKAGQHQFIRFMDTIINVDHIRQVVDDSANPGHCIVWLSDGTSLNIPNTAKKFSEVAGLDCIDYNTTLSIYP